MKHLIASLLILSLAGCGDSTSDKPKQNSPVETESINTDASDLLSSTRIATEKRTNSILVGSGWPGDKYGLRALCFTGDQVKTTGLKKIVHQIESQFYPTEKVWVFRIASYRIQSIVELKNIKPFPYTLERLGMEKFKQECGQKLVTKVFSGQRLFFEASVSQIQNLIPQNYWLLGTTQEFDIESFMSIFESAYPQFNAGYLVVTSGASGGIANPYPIQSVKDTAKAFVHNVQEYLKNPNLGEQVLEIYGVGTAPAY